MASGALPDGFVTPNAVVALAICDRFAAVAVPGRDGVSIPRAVVHATLSHLESLGPRWVWWSNGPALELISAGIRVSRCWDVSAVHRMLLGGWSSTAGEVWAHAHGLDVDRVPAVRPVDLFTPTVGADEADEPIRDDGHLRAEWTAGAWSESAARVVRWAELALDVMTRQENLLIDLDDPHPGVPRDPGRLRATALSESACELICAELEYGGLPFDREMGERIVAGFVGPRPTDSADERRRIAELDDTVLRHLPAGSSYDLRRPDQVRSLLRRVGIEVPDTRAWRLERIVGSHPIVEPLLAWRRSERIRTTFGYPWLDEHVGSDDRLRGSWSGSDGAAGRMTATAGLHNMPAEMRPAVVAEQGHLFVRADLGQIEPRVLAAVSGDRQLIGATHDDDLYAPVARRLGVDRPVAKVAVLGAMYGQTTGVGAEALRGLEREYPTAMTYLRRADEAAQGGHDLRTYGGRRIRMASAPAGDASAGDVRSRAAARGRYGRNAMVQGAAAEFFKTWAALVRNRGAALGARIVLCLHDELVVHVPIESAEDAARMIGACVDETARRWSPSGIPTVRFVADIAVVRRWSEAKEAVRPLRTAPVRRISSSR